jgi:hypothetical protein
MRFYPKRILKLDQCAFTRWLRESAKAQFETGSMRFYPMAAGERQSACQKWIDGE